MGKKRLRTKYVSKGERRPCAKKLLGSPRDLLTINIDLIERWRKHQNPWITVPNPAGGTKAPFIRVKANDYLGSPGRAFFKMTSAATEAA